MEKTKVFILRRLSNTTVTEINFNILSQSASSVCKDVTDYCSMNEALRLGKSTDIYIVTAIIDVIKLFLRRRKNILYWIQGVVPEESYLRHHSKIRFWIISLGEFFALKFSKLCLPVSTSMIKHYKTKYHYDISNKSYVFPCFNTQMQPWAFDIDGKYTNNYFIYAGGLDVWQCFSETLDLYKKIEDKKIPHTKLIVMTEHKDQAVKEIESRGIKNYEVGFTTREDLPNYLAKSKFGFVLRKQSPVNYVSTPTKISSYLSCGVIPICGKSVASFLELSKDTKYAVIWDENNDGLKDIISLMETRIEVDEIKRDYNGFFSTTYSSEYHKKNISDQINRMLRSL